MKEKTTGGYFFSFLICRRAINFRFLLPPLLLTSLLAAADDGWMSSVSARHGQIYSEVAHPEIQLKEEALFFVPEDDRYDDMGKLSVLALMRFYNHSKKDSSVEAAFPIELETESDSAVGAIVLHALGILKDTGDCDKDGCTGMIFSPKAKSLKHQVLTIEQFEKLNLESKSDQSISIPEIIFRGEKVKYNKVAIVTEFDESQKSRHVKLSFHFSHRLMFPKDSSELLAIQYSPRFKIASGGNGDNYSFDYVLKTAATWRPSFENLYVFVPEGLLLQEAAEFQESGRFAGLNIFHKQKIDAKLIPRLSIRYDGSRFRSKGGALSFAIQFPEQWGEKLGPAGYSKIPKNVIDTRSDVATNISESSALKGINEFMHFNRFKKRSEVKEDPFNVAQLFGFKTTFSGKALFDHFRESAWCYSPTKEIQASVKFSLTKNVSALGFLNGYQKPKDPFRDDEPKNSLFNRNGRIKSVGFFNLNGQEVGRMSLTDSNAFQAFPLSLKAGIYEMRVFDTYPGQNSKDICLSEIEFLPDLPGLYDFTLKGESFLLKNKFPLW